MNKIKQSKKLRNKLDKEWSIKVKEKDGNKCVICGDTKRLNAHHIIDRSNKELRHDIDNGLSLCPLHHRYSRIISAHQGSFCFVTWLLKNKSEQCIKLVTKLERI